MKKIIAMIVPLVGGLIGTVLGWYGSELSRKGLIVSKHPLKYLSI